MFLLCSLICNFIILHYSPIRSLATISFFLWRINCSSCCNLCLEFLLILCIVKMDSREEILANFQVVSGIKNLCVAIEILESVEWSFSAALNLVSSQARITRQDQFPRKVNIIEFSIFLPLNPSNFCICRFFSM